MAPKHFEEQLKDKLGKRELTPSDAAWKKLSSELETRTYFGKKVVVWIAAAAVFIGLITISVVLFNNARPLEQKKVIIVDSPKIELSPRFEDEIKEIPEANILHRLPTEREIKIVDQQKTSIENKEKSTLKNIETKSVEVAESQKELPNVKVLPLKQQKIINTKIEEVLAQVALMEKENAILTNAEVDSLLLRAQQELFKEKIFRDNHSVDAMALLADVEYELDKSFRKQIFDLLKDGYLKVKTAVAARNN